MTITSSSNKCTFGLKLYCSSDNHKWNEIDCFTHSKFEEFDLNYTFYENKKYAFKIECENIIDTSNEIRLYVNDFAISLTGGNGTYFSDFKAYFMNYIDSLRFYVEVGTQDPPIMLTSKNFFLATTKIDTKNIEMIFKEIQEMDSRLLEACFSKSMTETGIDYSRTSSIQHIYDLMVRIISTYKENITLFKTQKNKVIRKEKKAVDSNLVRQIDGECIKWAISKPNNTYKKKSSIYDEKYKFRKMLSINTYEDSNTYENRIVVGFLKCLLQFMNQLSADLGRIIDSRRTNAVLGINVEEGYEIPTRAYYDLITNHYKKLSLMLCNLNNECSHVYNMYRKILGCEGDCVVTKPNYTHIFKHLIHYRRIFLHITEFFEIKRYDFRTNNMLVRVEKLSKIFEYYCLLKLLNSLETLGYKVIDSNRLYQSKINDYYMLADSIGEYSIELFYEPLIYSEPSKNDKFNMYRAGRSNNYLSPDYVIALKNIRQDSVVYGVIDAKYSSVGTVRDYYMSNCMEKYLHDIVVYNSDCNTPVFLDFFCATRDKNGQDLYDYHRNHRKYLGDIVPSIHIINYSPKVFMKDLDEHIDERIKLLKSQLSPVSETVEGSLREIV